MKHHMRAGIVGAVIVSSTVVAAIAHGQSGKPGTVTATISGIVPVPVGPLIDNRDAGVGLTAGLRYVPAALSHFASRLELSGLPASAHDNGAPNSSPTVSNGSSALFATMGPELDIPAGNGHFYTTAMAGIAHIWASSSAISGATPDFGPYYTFTERQATNIAWGGGAGFVTARSSSGLAGEIGLRYYDLGRATYVTSYPSVTFFPDFVTKAYSTTGHHRTTFLAPSIGLSWHP
jgi:hypothetical protein